MRNAKGHAAKAGLSGVAPPRITGKLRRRLLPPRHDVCAHLSLLPPRVWVGLRCGRLLQHPLKHAVRHGCKRCLGLLCEQLRGPLAAGGGRRRRRMTATAAANVFGR